MSFENDLSGAHFTPLQSAVLLANTISPSGLAASSGSSLVGTIAAGAGAVARTVQAKERDVVSVLDFYANGVSGVPVDPTGVVDSTLGIQAAINTGKNVVFDASRGTYLTTATLNLTNSNQVVDFQYSTINLSDATGLISHLTVGDNITQVNAVHLLRGVLTRSQVASAGAGIKAQYVGLLKIDDMRVYGNSRIYDAIILSRSIQGKISNCYLQNTVHHGITMSGTGTGANRTVDNEIINNRIESIGNTGLNTSDFVEGLFCRENIFFSCSTAAVACNASSDANGLISFFFFENDFDTCGAGAYLQNISNIHFTDNWFSANTGINLQIDTAVVGVVISDNQLYGSAGSHSIQVGGKDVVITGNYLSGGNDGIHFKTAADSCAVDGNLIKNMSAWGVNLAEVPTKTRLGFNVFGSNSTGDVNPGTLSPTIASAASVSLPVNGTIFNISGTTNFGTLVGGYAEREVTLIFAGALSVFHSLGGATTMALQGGATFNTAANNTLTLQHDGVQWWEKCRKT